MGARQTILERGFISEVQLNMCVTDDNKISRLAGQHLFIAVFNNIFLETLLNVVGVNRTASNY